MANDDRWSSLLPELLLLILIRVSHAADRVRFGSVCTWWRSLLMESRRLLPPADPLMILPYTEDNLPPYRVYGVPASWIHRVLLPDPDFQTDEDESNRLCQHRPKKFVFGSSMGWLFVSDCGDIRLWNPVTRAEIFLPLAPTHWGRCLHGIFCNRKGVLSWNPHRVAVVISKCSGDLSFCRLGEERWTPIFDGFSEFDDAVFYQGRLYAVTSEGKVVVCDDLGGPDPPEVTQVGTRDFDRNDYVKRCTCYHFKHYLVESSSSGELLKVLMVYEDSYDDDEVTVLTTKFVVHKLEEETWRKVRSIGDQALFLGASSSMSFTASETHGGRCRKNCIYFLDIRSDMGVFDLEDGSITTFGIDEVYYCSSDNYNCSTRLCRPPQFWINLVPWEHPFF